jgi:hypothetical protein
VTSKLISSIVGAGVNRYIVALTGSGTFTVPQGVSALYVTLIGGGGSGGYMRHAYGPTHYSGAIGGYAGAGCMDFPVIVTPGQEISYSVGAGGAGATTNTDGLVVKGNTGGDTTFGNLTGYGGLGGGSALNATATNVDIPLRDTEPNFVRRAPGVIQGTQAHYIADCNQVQGAGNLGVFTHGTYINEAEECVIGGAPSPFGNGGNAGGGPTTANGQAGRGPGAGGGGFARYSAATGTRSGAGADGAIWVTYYA